jgi:hypothetical protein
MRSLLNSFIFWGALFSALAFADGKPRPMGVVDARWENVESRTLRPHLLLAQQIITQGFSGDVYLLVDDDYQNTWAAGLNLGSMETNESGGKLHIITASEAAAAPPRETQFIVRFAAQPQDVPAPFAEVAGFEFGPQTVFFKVSLLENSDRPALETFLGGPASAKNFDGWIHFGGETFEIQSPAMRLGVDDRISILKLHDYSELLEREDAARLALEMLVTHQNFRSGAGGNWNPHVRFMDFSKEFKILKSRLHLAYHAAKKCPDFLKEKMTDAAAEAQKTKKESGGWLDWLKGRPQPAH